MTMTNYTTLKTSKDVVRIYVAVACDVDAHDVLAGLEGCVVGHGHLDHPPLLLGLLLWPKRNARFSVEVSPSVRTLYQVSTWSVLSASWTTGPGVRCQRSGFGPLSSLDA